MIKVPTEKLFSSDTPKKRSKRKQFKAGNVRKREICEIGSVAVSVLTNSFIVCLLLIHSLYEHQFLGSVESFRCLFMRVSRFHFPEMCDNTWDDQTLKVETKISLCVDKKLRFLCVVNNEMSQTFASSFNPSLTDNFCLFTKLFLPRNEYQKNESKVQWTIMHKRLDKKFPADLFQTSLITVLWFYNWSWMRQSIFVWSLIGSVYSLSCKKSSEFQSEGEGRTRVWWSTLIFYLKLKLFKIQ